jgi:S-adenosylmethionine decarboxylase
MTISAVSVADAGDDPTDRAAELLSAGAFGMELVLDLVGCDPATIRSKERLVAYARELCRVVDMTPYGAPFVERFGEDGTKTAGYSLVQLIETSSITGHFSEQSDRAYLNVFSCKHFDPRAATEFTQRFFAARAARHTLLIRE